MLLRPSPQTHRRRWTVRRRSTGVSRMSNDCVPVRWPRRPRPGYRSTADGRNVVGALDRDRDVQAGRLVADQTLKVSVGLMPAPTRLHAVPALSRV